jgi:hypothetical protein
MRAVIALADPAHDRVLDFHLTMLGRPTTIVFTDVEEANEFAAAVTSAWSATGYVGAVLQLEADTTEDAIRELTEMWPAYGQNAFLDAEHPAVVEMMQELRAGGRLDGPSI